MLVLFSMLEVRPRFHSVERDYLWVTGFLCSKQVYGFMRVMNPTLNFQVGNVVALPFLREPIHNRQSEIEKVVKLLILHTRADWNAYERSWDFESLPILMVSSDATPTLESSYTAWAALNRETIAEMKRLEEENNRLFIDAYGLRTNSPQMSPLSRSPSR